MRIKLPSHDLSRSLEAQQSLSSGGACEHALRAC